ncbi:MAG: ATP synthase F1 subunit delta [Chloroflexi bacterium]|nr:ATP synthase F1 subunit delta [Chloroflexota bacterium]
MAGASPRRYAQAAFALALENEGVDRWETDLQRVLAVLADADVMTLLSAPQVPERVKLDGVTTLLPDVAPLIRNMVSMMVMRGDISKIGRAVQAFNGMADDSRDTARALVVTAVPLDDDRRGRLEEGLAALVNRKQVVLTERLDPEIVGGVIARVGDRLIDGSTRTRLRALRDELAAGR